jgi:hypothetical protein
MNLPLNIQKFTNLASTSNSSDEPLIGLIFLIFCLLYFIPFMIALFRGHSYKWVILGLNVLGFFGITWLFAFIWAVWPKGKSLIDPIVGNVTGTGQRNSGDTIGSIDRGIVRGRHAENDLD